MSTCWPGFWLVVHSFAANQEPGPQVGTTLDNDYNSNISTPGFRMVVHSSVANQEPGQQVDTSLDNDYNSSISIPGDLPLPPPWRSGSPPPTSSAVGRPARKLENQKWRRTYGSFGILFFEGRDRESVQRGRREVSLSTNAWSLNYKTSQVWEFLLHLCPKQLLFIQNSQSKV